MIYTLLQSSAAHPDLATGRVPLGLLTPAEQAVFEGLKSDKRRRDWLLGRWTGKRLVQALAEGYFCIGHGVPLDAVEILPAEDGAPTASLLTNHESRITLSISHSHEHAFCGLAVGVPLGVDLERVEARSEGFVRDYFVGEEIALVEAVPRESREGVVTAIWSAKESALKAIRLGLSVDTFAVKCLPQGSGADWSPVLIEWDLSKLQRAAPALTGWWRVWKEFVLTVAITKSSQEFPPIPISSGEMGIYGSL
ncbi:MAG: 4'-phosphopantetheinyl transferase superfamily protein [Anaerolineales bacterium]|nr:4'-phosphopantetheinyl transferase superfamily protein [Anaerolineales bacterium]